MTDLVALTCRIARALDAAGIDYAIGGAIALGFHAPPRGTQDIDLNLFVEPSAARAALDRLMDEGLEIDVATALASFGERGDARGTLDGVRIDLFVNSIPLHAHAHARRLRANLAGTPLWILSAEDLVTLKLLYFRPKDLDDTRRVLAVQGEAFDVGYVRVQLTDHVGSDDRRVAEFEVMVEMFGDPPKPA